MSCHKKRACRPKIERIESGHGCRPRKIRWLVSETVLDPVKDVFGVIRRAWNNRAERPGRQQKPALDRFIYARRLRMAKAESF